MINLYTGDIIDNRLCFLKLQIEIDIFEDK